MNDVKEGVSIGERLGRFFASPFYPPLVCLLVLLGHSLSLEVVFCTVNVLLVSAALLTSHTARPAITFVVTFVYQISRTFSPGMPNKSDYYFTSWRLPLVFVLGAVLLSSVVVFIVRERVFRGAGMHRSMPIIGLLVFAASMAANGIFSPKWTFGGTIYGLCVAGCLFFVFVFFYYGMRREDPKELAEYFCYCSMWCAVLLILELAVCYAELDINRKDDILLGWGVSNTMGVGLTALLPTSILGAVRASKKWMRPIYFVTLLGTLVAIYYTDSRNALLCSAITLLLCALALVFHSRHKLVGAALLGSVILVGSVLAIIYSDALVIKLEEFFWDNGRFRLWEHGMNNFSSAPVFGVGFYGYDIHTFFTADFLPTMAHNTVVQLLSSGGIFALLAYVFYRVTTVIPVFRRPELSRTMIALSALAMLIESMLDNFIFYFIPVLHYSIAVAIIFILCEHRLAEQAQD